jgi:Family of unknown function (DUF6221)
MDLTAFLRKMLDEDATAAQAACLFGTGNWTQADPVRYPGLIDSDTGTVVYDEGSPTSDQAAHIARCNPERVLREVAAKRRILADYEMWRAHADSEPRGVQSVSGAAAGALLPAVRHLAAAYSDHPDYPAP